MKIPFNLEKYNTGKYDVVIRDGAKVRILCTDLKSSYQIVGVIYGEYEVPTSFDINGKFDKAVESCNDLMLVTPKILVNGIEVPKPESKAPNYHATYYVPDFNYKCYVHVRSWTGDDDLDLRCLKRGLIHLDEESAIIHAKAMLGIKE